MSPALVWILATALTLVAVWGALRGWRLRNARLALVEARAQLERAREAGNEDEVVIASQRVEDRALTVRRLLGPLGRERAGSNRSAG